MTLITTPGAIDADSWASLEEAADYALKYGRSFPTSPVEPAEQALRRGRQVIDVLYAPRYPGEQTSTTQALSWPRKYVCYRGGVLADDAIPDELKAAQIEAAIRELATPNSMLPDLERGGGIRSLKAGSVAIEYAGNASARTTFTAIDGILSGLLGTASLPWIGQAVRG